MTLSALVAAAYLRATGEVSTLTSSDTDYKKLVQFANIHLRSWANEPDSDWETLYDPAINLGVISNTDTYDLDDSIARLSTQGDDWVQITHTDGVTVTNYQTVPAKRLKFYQDKGGKFCARVGRTLKFNKVFTTTDPEYGGTITVPAYTYPDDLVKDTDTVIVDNPDWLVLMTAASWCQTDVTLAQNYPALINEANNLMTAMKQFNGAQEDTVDLGNVGRSTEW